MTLWDNQEVVANTFLFLTELAHCKTLVALIKCWSFYLRHCLIVILRSVWLIIWESYPASWRLTTLPWWCMNRSNVSPTLTVIYTLSFASHLIFVKYEKKNVCANFITRFGSPWWWYEKPQFHTSVYNINAQINSVRPSVDWVCMCTVNVFLKDVLLIDAVHKPETLPHPHFNDNSGLAQWVNIPLIIPLLNTSVKVQASQRENGFG